MFETKEAGKPLEFNRAMAETDCILHRQVRLKQIMDLIRKGIKCKKHGSNLTFEQIRQTVLVMVTER